MATTEFICPNPDCGKKDVPWHIDCGYCLECCEKLRACADTEEWPDMKFPPMP